MKSFTLLFISLFSFTFSYAQIGINATTIDPSAALDIQFGTSPKGLLTPRMTTAQKLAIATPADGLIVYDTDLKSFYHYKTGSPGAWIRISSEASGRTNFKRIKSTDVLATVLAAEKVAGGANYKLDANTYYEINGAVTFDAPIELNNAYLVGLDANEDKILRTGNLFVGATGGTIKNVTITVTGGNVFTLAGAGNTQSLIFRDSVVQGCSNVGTISGFGLVFSSVVQYISNTTGIEYANITRVLLSNVGWFANNLGTFEKFTGTFSLIQKVGGFMEVNGSAVGIDVSNNPTITGDAVLESVVFTGTNIAKYINPYTINTYTGYNFNNSWSVRSTGIPTEADAAATSNLYKTNNRTIASTNATVADTGYKVETTVGATTTTATNLFRFVSTPARLTYKGKKTRAFQASATVSFEATTGTTNTDYVFYFAKISSNGTTVTPLTESETYIDTNSSFIQAFPISGTIVLAENESVELYLKRITTGTNLKTRIDVRSYNLSLK